jgi:Tfp pilus assembly protein PilN
VAAIAIVVLLAAVWAFAQLRLQSKQDELAAIEQQVQSTTALAEQLSVFEQRAAELEARRATANRALAARRDWGKLFNELSLVLPADIWLQTLTTNEESGLDMAGYALDSPTDVPDNGHKSMAKMLIRLADLEQLSDVWLTDSVKTQFLDQDVVQLTATAAVSVPATGSVTP